MLDEVIRSEPGPRTKDMLLIFVRAGVDFTRPISHGFDAVTWACAWRRVDLAQMLGKPGGAALCMACDPRLLVPGRLETAAWVLQHDVDLELRHRYFFHRTPLLLAIRAADPALVQLLLDHGADTSAADDDGTTAAALLERAEWFPG